MTTLDITASPLPEAEHRAQLRSAMIASTVGTTIEWYDFLLYSTVTGLVFGKLFFCGRAVFPRRFRSDDRKVLDCGRDALFANRQT
jgi:hypothetical protein